MRTVDNPSSPVIQLLLPPSRSPKFHPLTFPLFPLVLVISQVVISKPQLGQLWLTKGDGQAKRCQIYFPVGSVYPMLRKASRQLDKNPRMLRNQLTLKATRKSSRNVLSKLTCAPCVGAATTPFGPMTGPGNDSDGALDEVPFRRPKNSLTAPSTFPVVYKSRPIFRSQLKHGLMEPIPPSACSIPGTIASNPFQSS